MIGSWEEMRPSYHKPPCCQSRSPADCVPKCRRSRPPVSRASENLTAHARWICAGRWVFSLPDRGIMSRAHIRRHPMTRSLLALLLLPASAFAQKDKPDPTLAPIKDEPGLPRVLLIGDSISMGYTIPVRELLKGKANVHRVPENGGPTINGLKRLAQELGGGKWDVSPLSGGWSSLGSDR